MNQNNTQINEGDLKFFSAHALSGLLSNPYLVSIEGQRYLQIKKLTLEKLAAESALELMMVLTVIKEGLDRAEKNSAEVESVTKNMTVVEGE